MWDLEFEKMLRSYLPFLLTDAELAMDSDLRDLGLDSLNAVELLASLENAYQVRFRDDMLDMNNFATPGTLWSTLSGADGRLAS
ncbi:acyl carrier protein [Nocardia sp. NPDC050175]|uniref:acyl carrier protein n=1 Tax=Nocardia sp. NPDC050175 TaxID=3364317 RepID=UPI0037AD4859